MNQSAPVTIAIPYYDKPHFLIKAIKSVQNQTHQNWSLIICDDQGPAPQVESDILALNDSRIRYHKNPRNLGLAGNWNQCVRHVETEYFLLLHSDDELSPRYLEKMLALASTHTEASAYFCRPEIIDAKSRTVFSFVDFYKELLITKTGGLILLKGEKGLSSLLRGNFICCPSILYRKSKVPSDPLFNETLRCVPDWDLTLRYLLEGRSLVGTTECLFRYRRHGASVTDETRVNLRMFEEELTLRAKIAHICKKMAWEEAEEMARSTRGMTLAIGFFALKDILAFRFDSLLKKLDFALNLTNKIKQLSSVKE